MISEKQKMILAFPYTKKTALICDGAVRSGKTSLMTVAFIDWAMRNFRDMRFGICGKTIGSAFTVAEEIEFVSELYCRASMLGGMRLLSETEIEDAIERFRHYGQ